MFKKITFFLVAIPFLVFAQDTTQIELQQVTVTANMHTTELRQAARNISIITAKQIEESPVKTIDGILQYALNVDVRTRSPFGVQTDIGIRGGHFDQTLILVDGVKMNDPQTGHHSLNLPFSISEIEKIEVLQGGVSRVFGPAAFSGVINIITKKVKHNSVDLNAGIGQFGLNQVNGALSVKKAAFSSRINAERISSNGYAYNTAFEKFAIFSKNEVNFGKNTLNIEGGISKNQFGASNFYHPKFKDQYEVVASSFLIGQLTSQFSNNFQSNLIFSIRNHLDFYDFNLFRFTDPPFVNHHKTNVLDAEWKGRWLNKLGKTSFGVEWRQENIMSNRLGNTLEKPIEVKNYYGAFYTKKKVRENVSGYFEHQIQKDGLLLSFGTLLNFNSQFGTSLYPGIDISKTISKNSTVYASLNKSLRFPTFTEMYLNTSTVKGNPDVKPEKAWGYEIGIKHTNRLAFTTVSVFLRDSEEAIDKVLRVNQSIPSIENINNVKIGGIELSTVLNPCELFNLKRFTSFQLNYSFTTGNKQEVDFLSFYTLNYLRHKFAISNSIKFNKNLNLVLNYTFKKRLGSFQLDATSPLLTYDPVHLVDTRLSWKKSQTQIFIDCNNLLNQNYYEFGFVEQPRRWVSAGLNLKF